MSNLLQTDVRAYRTCILYEVLHKKPVREAYKNMKKVMPNIDFLDFKFWYYRFLSGNHDLDLKIHGLPDMPTNVMERIVRKLDVADRLSLRKVSRNLRSIVDNEKTNCESVSIKLSQNSSTLKIDNATIDYKFVEEGVCSINRHRSYERFEKEKKKEKLIKNSVHWELAINDFSSFLMNPNWKFGKIKIDFDLQMDFEDYDEKDEDDSERLNFLKSIFQAKFSGDPPIGAHSKIDVDFLEVRSITLKPMATLLPYFNPEPLKKISFSSEKIYKKLMTKIMETDHWKTAEEMTFYRIPDWFDVKHFFHLKEVTVSKCVLEFDRICTVRDVLLKSKTLDWLSLGTQSKDDGIDYEDVNHFDEDQMVLNSYIEAIMEMDPAYSNGRYNVEGADYYFGIRCDRWQDTVCLDVRKCPISD